MKLKTFKARLCTAGKTQEQIKNDYEGDVTEKQIKDLQRAFDLIDGKEVAVIQFSTSKDRYTLAGWSEKDDSAIRDFIYQAEQDDMFGNYIDDREQFLKDWEDETYEPMGSLGFDKSDVEIIEEMKKVKS